jgi:hypothetical protein
MTTALDKLLHDPSQRPVRHPAPDLHDRIMLSLDDPPAASVPRSHAGLVGAVVIMVGIVGLIALVATWPRQAAPVENRTAVNTTDDAERNPLKFTASDDLMSPLFRIDVQLSDAYRREAELLAADARRTISRLSSRIPMF